MKVGDLVVYKRSFCEKYGFSTETVFETCGFGIVLRTQTNLEDPQFYVLWNRGHDCWEYPDELEVLSESR